MNTSKLLYEQAYYNNTKLTPDQENILDAKYGALYAQNVVKRKLHGVRVNQLIRQSVYAEQYEQLPRSRSGAFDMTLNQLNEQEEKTCDSGSKCSTGDTLSVKSSLVQDLINALEDQFDCDPSLMNSEEDFDRIAGLGSDMKNVLLIKLDDPECCKHNADRIKHSIMDVDDGNELLQQLYLDANEHF